MRVPSCITLVCATFALTATCFAQGTASITGRVTDPTGSVIPGVKVNVIQNQNNFRFEAATNDDGIFRVLSLQPGTYQLTFEAGGFKRLVREGVELRVDDTLPVDAVLQIGNVSESIEVTGQTQLLETETSATGTVVEGNYLYKLPLYQRYVNSTLNLVPGMTAGGFAYGGDLGSYHLAGQRNGSIGIFQNGALGNDQNQGTNTIKPIQNSVEEVKVLTTALPAEYGHSAGGVISVVDKSGTNQIHGLASDYGRTRRMSHRLFFDKFKNSQPTLSSPNGITSWFMEPDANVGGPVLLPKIYNGRNKTFFFFGYQKLIEKKNAQAFGNTPTDAMKAGDFTFAGLPSANPIYDPATTRQDASGNWVRDQFPGNKIPLSRFDPVALKVLALNPWRAPNFGNSFSSTGPVNNFLYNEFSRTFFEDFTGRLDHQFSPNLKIFGSITYNHQSGLGRPRVIQVQDFDADEGNLTPLSQQNASLGATWVVNPTLVNEARASYFRRRTDKLVPSFGKNYGQILGIPNITGDLLPAFGTGDKFSPDSVYGLTVSGPNKNIGETITFRDDVSKIWGTHAFKFGYELLRLRLDNTTANHPSGDFRFDGMTTGLLPDGNNAPNTGNTFAGFLLGYVRQAQFDQELTSWLPRSSIHSFYLQDDWKFSPTLTLNLGVRYSNEGAFNTKYGFQSNFNPNAIDPVTGLKGAITHAKGGLNARDNNNFNPRIGAAWHPFDKWVFRGGFGMYTVDVKFPQTRGNFDEYVAQVNEQRAPGDPRPLFRIDQNPTSPAYLIRPDQTSGFIGNNYSARSVQWWDPKLRNPYVLNFNATVQYALSSSYLLEVGYQGSSGIGLIERWQQNTFPVDLGANDPALRAASFRAPQNYRPFPQFGDIWLRSNFGHSTFHSGTVKLDKRFSRGLSFITFYTFSKAIDSQDDDGGNGATGNNGVAPLTNRRLEKGRAGFDRNHRLIGSAVYELPFGNGKRFMNRGGVWNYLFGGYEVAWIQTIESGNPLNFDFTNSPDNYYPTFAGLRRPNAVGTPALRDGWQDLGGDRFTLLNINPIIDINHFAYPAAFQPGNLGRNVVTGTPTYWSQASAKKNFRVRERFNVQLRWDFQNALHTYNFNPPTTTVDLKNPKTFAKLSSDPRTANLGGQPLMNLALQVTW